MADRPRRTKRSGLPASKARSGQSSDLSPEAQEKSLFKLTDAKMSKLMSGFKAGLEPQPRRTGRKSSGPSIAKPFLKGNEAPDESLQELQAEASAQQVSVSIDESTAGMTQYESKSIALLEEIAKLLRGDES